MTADGVVDNAAAGRYELVIGEETAVLEYRRMSDGTLALIHTGVPEPLAGHGVGQRLVTHVLDEARRRSTPVLPFCPFVAAYIRRHPEYMSVVSPRYKGFDRDA